MKKYWFCRLPIFLREIIDDKNDDNLKEMTISSQFEKCISFICDGELAFKIDDFPII